MQIQSELVAFTSRTAQKKIYIYIYIHIFLSIITNLSQLGIVQFENWTQIREAAECIRMVQLIQYFLQFS